MSRVVGDACQRPQCLTYTSDRLESLAEARECLAEPHLGIPLAASVHTPIVDTTSGNAVWANFRESDKAEVRRFTLPRTPVNRGSRDAYGPSLPRRALSADNNRAEATASPAAKYSRLPTTISPPPALASQ